MFTSKNVRRIEHSAHSNCEDQKGDELELISDFFLHRACGRYIAQPVEQIESTIRQHWPAIPLKLYAAIFHTTLRPWRYTPAHDVYPN